MKKVREFLESQSLHVDPEIFLQFHEDDIIEIYSFPDHRQLFSNQQFRKHCSYTDEQMTQLPFTQLFWRSDEDQGKLLRRAQHVVLHEKNWVPWNVENHDLVEALHPKKRAFEMQMGVIAPIFDSSNKAIGFLSTCRVVFTFEWKEEIS